jgi:hypothetical protein
MELSVKLLILAVMRLDPPFHGRETRSRPIQPDPVPGMQNEYFVFFIHTLPEVLQIAIF